MGEHDGKRKGFLKKISRRGKFFRTLAIAILVVDRFCYYVFVYAKKGFRRYAFAAFLMMSFLLESSFSHPEQAQTVRGSSNPKQASEELFAITDSDIELVEEPESEYEDTEILKDEDVIEACDETWLMDSKEPDMYSVDEILSENAQILPEEPSQYSEEAVLDSHSFDVEDWKLVLINKQHPIPEDYTFTLDTIKTANGGIQCDGRVMEELFSMLQAAKEEEITLAICSHYRDLSRQEVLFNRKIKKYMKKGMSYMEAYRISSQTVTVPGASEHQIGLAFDIISDDYTVLEEGFAETDAGIWLKEHCAEYGFILRYPKGKETITGIEFEPWHFRYVGKEAAEIIMNEELCLEEFWGEYVGSASKG